MKDDQKYFLHILACIRRIEEDVNEGEATFLQSHTIQDAVIRNLQVLAESTKRISSVAKQAKMEIDWSAIAGLRNLLVHDYFGVDLETIWRIVAEDLPSLKSAIQRLVNPPSPP